MKTKLATAATAALAATSVLAIGATAAYAGKPVVTPGAGSSVSCTFTAKAKLSPPLKNDWDPADHTTDPDTVVAGLPYQTFAATTPVTTSAKGKSVSCTGSVVDATSHISYPVSSMKLSAASTTGTPPFHDTCGGLADISPGTTFASTLTWKLSGASMPVTTVTSSLASLLDSHGPGFDLTATAISGPFAGGTSETKAYVDGNTFAILAAAGVTATSTSPAAPNVCEPSLKIKAASPKKPESVTLKGPKGFKKIGIGPGAFDQAGSTLTISLP